MNVNELTLKKEIDELKNIPLSDTLFENLGIKLLLWEDIPKYKSIEEVVPCCLYIPISNKFSGHYVLLWIKDGILFYFCSYGYTMNIAINKSLYLNETPEKDEDYLYIKLRDYIQRGGKISFNPYRFQGKNENLSTCGRYCIIRYLKIDLNHDEFKKWFSYLSINNDNLATLLTFII